MGAWQRGVLVIRSGTRRYGEAALRLCCGSIEGHRVASRHGTHDTCLVQPLRARFLGVSLGAFGVVACGPSFQAVYECDVRFEHCYALDQGTASVELKKQCWRDWLHGYTYGQSGDRIEYAAARFSELSLDPTLPSVEVREARPTRRSAAPVPTSAFAPPPNLADRPAADASAPSSKASGEVREVVVRAPGSDCAEVCATSWKSCHDACRGVACDECDKRYRACVPGCFREEPSPPRAPAEPRAMH
jgi:hypothetical protein